MYVFRQVCEFLLHWMPALKSVDIVFVGPELCVYDGDNWQFCGECAAREATVRHEFATALYVDYCASATYERPDIVAVFNCGFHEYQNAAADPWAGSLPRLLAPNVPLLITSYTRGEAKQDLERLKPIIDNRVVKTIACQRNRFRSLLPLRDWSSPSEFYYKNNFYTVIQVCQ